MRCVICKHGETRPGTATVPFTKDDLTLVVKDVPARICQTCGKEYVDQEIATQLLQTADVAANTGVQVEVRRYVAA